VRENSSSAIVIDENDNVALAIKILKAGETVTLITGQNRRALKLKDDIQFMHKFAVSLIKAGDRLMKYGQPVGTATQDIAPGAHVDSDNSKNLRGQFMKKRAPRKTE
jgi:hypothetical protein